MLNTYCLTYLQWLNIKISGSCVLKALAAVCQSISSINTLNHPSSIAQLILDHHSIDILADTLKKLYRRAMLLDSTKFSKNFNILHFIKIFALFLQSNKQCFILAHVHRPESGLVFLLMCCDICLVLPLFWHWLFKRLVN